MATPAERSLIDEWRAEFEAAARRPLRTRFRYAFVHTYKPVLDDAAYRSFDTTAAYREWCARHLPDWLGYGPAVCEYAQVEEIRDAFARFGVRYLFIGKSGAILLGYPDTTQDAALFLEKSQSNGSAAALVLRDLGFALSDDQAAEIERGKDFVQLKNGPFDLDLVFAPDGIESFARAWERRVDVESFPVCHPDDIIRSKEAAGRVKDREVLPRLRAFRDYWLGRNR